MPDPEEVSKGLGDMIRQGLGMFGQGVSTIAEVLKSGDTALQQVDGALTGNRPKTELSLAGGRSEEDVAQRVVSLVHQGQEETNHNGDPTQALVVSRFQEAMRLLFQIPIPSRSGLSDLMPSPADALRTGLRDLRGSMALVRLANGTGSLSDVEEVARFAEALVGRMQHGVQPSQKAVPQPETPAARSTQGKNPRPSRRRTSQGRKEPANSSAVVFARSMGESMNDPVVKRWATDMANGKVTEDQFIDRWSRRVEDGNRGNPEELLAKAKERSIENGLAPTDPYLEEL